MAWRHGTKRKHRDGNFWVYKLPKLFYKFLFTILKNPQHLKTTNNCPPPPIRDGGGIEFCVRPKFSEIFSTCGGLKILWNVREVEGGSLDFFLNGEKMLGRDGKTNGGSLNLVSNPNFQKYLLVRKFGNILTPE